jgi:hypothetical protein
MYGRHKATGIPPNTIFLHTFLEQYIHMLNCADSSPADAEFHAEINSPSDLSETIVLAKKSATKKRVSDVDLISPRFEASVSEMFICVSVDTTANLTYPVETSVGGRKKKKPMEPSWKSLIKVFEYIHVC